MEELFAFSCFFRYAWNHPSFGSTQTHVLFSFTLGGKEYPGSAWEGRIPPGIPAASSLPLSLPVLPLGLLGAEMGQFGALWVQQGGR